MSVSCAVRDNSVPPAELAKNENVLDIGGSAGNGPSLSPRVAEKAAPSAGTGSTDRPAERTMSAEPDPPSVSRVLAVGAETSRSDSPTWSSCRAGVSPSPTPARDDRKHDGRRRLETEPADIGDGRLPSLGQSSEFARDDHLRDAAMSSLRDDRNDASSVTPTSGSSLSQESPR